MSKTIFAAVSLFLLNIALSTIAYPQDRSLSEYAGRYSDGADYALYFENTKYGLTIRPVMWTATQLLGRTSGDKFEVVDRTSRGADFNRNAAGVVNGVTIRGMDGEGLTLTRSVGPLLPVELFLAGRTAAAARAYVSRGPDGLSKALETAQEVLERLPTKTLNVVAFLNALEPHVGDSSRFYAIRGYAYVQAGRRSAALPDLERAYRLDNHNEEAISALAMLGRSPAGSGQGKTPWKLPFPLDRVFAKPTAAEISEVERDWATRDLSTQGVREETRGTVRFGSWQANVRIVSHLVHGSRHYGAVIYPDPQPGVVLPVIILAKGVSPTYFPLDVKDSPDAGPMGDMADRFIYVVPSFRGEVLNFDGRNFTSEGDRRDALDGATDDTLALLNVILQTTPQADAGRICIYGHSRGGNVALLAGIRDRRIKCVADLAGPTDWFYLMGTNGWTEQELWTEGVRIHASPVETGGQDLERFMGKAIEGKADLVAVRHNMIASSPLYFAKRLPRAQLHYGLEDPFVPVQNGRKFVRQLVLSGVPRSRYQAFFYPGQGHDTDRIAAPRMVRDFIAEALDVR